MIVLKSTVCILLALGFVQSERCFTCTGVDHPHNCSTISTCNTGERCAVKQYVTASGALLYDVECLPEATCQALGNIFGKRDAERAVTDVTTCEECCTGDFCNNQGCGTTAVAAGDRGPLCFACDSAAGPDTCSDVKVCAKGEQCLLYLFPELSTPDQYVYRSMCEPAAACSIISSLHQNALCEPNCCSTDLCNNQCGTSAPTCDTSAGWLEWTSPTSAPLCVKIHSEHMNWDGARAKCQSEGGDLVVLDTVDKSLLARQQVTADPSVNHQSGLWIGAKDFDSSNQFRWVNNQDVVVANGDWDNNQPNHQDGGHVQDCALMWRTSTISFQWHDDWCDKTLPFICEMK